MHLPYVRLRPEDLPESARIWGWEEASTDLLEALGVGNRRPLPIPLAGSRSGAPGATRRQAREGLAALLALEPSHPDRTLYLEALELCDRGFEAWLLRRIGRALATERPRMALCEAAAAVNLRPGQAEARFNLALVLTRMAGQDPLAPDARRWAALARGEFARAAELSPDLFWGYYHRGVLAYDAALPEAAKADWLCFLDRYVADKPAPAGFDLRLLPLDSSPESAELPGLAYAVLLDLLGLPRPEPAPTQQASPPALS